MKKSKKIWQKRLDFLGGALILAGVAILVFTFWPVAKEEVKYSYQQTFNIKYSVDPQPGSKEKKISPPNTDFSIVIPKIGAVAPIVDNVDPIDPKNYLAALKKGVAHAAGTAYPGHFGNTYLFAHSTDTFYNVNRYNAVFYLIGKLEKGDEIDIWYQGQRIKYEVTDKKVVEANEVAYLGNQGEWNTLTLQTCYPPGTTLRRLVVVAKQV
jgi:sortase A